MGRDASRSAGLGKVLALAAGAVLLLILGRRAAAWLPTLIAGVAALGPWGPAAFMALYAVAVVALVPASILTLAAGALFGLARGTAYTFVAATVGATAAFLVARHLARGWVERRIAGDPRFEAIDRAVGDRGLWIVFLLRLSPAFPFNILNYALGLTRVRLRDYVLASVGMIPGTVLYVYAGRVAGDVAAAVGGAPVEAGPGRWIVLGLGLLATIVATAAIARIARGALTATSGEVRYDLVVIGAGPGGLVCAAGAAGLGAKVALVERHVMGGDCLNFGCIPSKGVIRAARAWSDAASAAAMFGGPSVSGPGDFPQAMTRMRRLRADLARHDSVSRFRDLGVDVRLGHGRFASPSVVEVDGARLTFRRAVIATGSRPIVPPIAGLAEAGYLTNETVFDLDALPRRLIVIGAGPIGCELGQAFARFGAAVTILDRGGEILPKDDPEAAAVVRRAMERDGVAFRLGATILDVAIRGAERHVRVSIDGREDAVAGEAILVAAGRAPNVEDLGLDAAGIAAGPHGIDVNDRLRTTNPTVYALGDVASRFKFTHAADAQARLVLANALFFGRSKASRLVIPWVTYTSPELAHVGLTAREADEAGLAYDVFTVPMAGTDRGVLDGDDDGFLRVLVKKNTDRILGATLVAEHAGEMIAEIALAVTSGLGLSAIGRTVHPYPTRSEVIRKAADAWRRTKLTPRARRILERYFGLLR